MGHACSHSSDGGDFLGLNELDIGNHHLISEQRATLAATLADYLSRQKDLKVGPLRAFFKNRERRMQ